MSTTMTETAKTVNKNTIEYAKKWIEDGKPCCFRYGWGWKGAGARPLTKEQALKKLPGYAFGKGFYTLSFIKIDGVDTLEFNELSENDMW